MSMADKAMTNAASDILLLLFMSLTKSVSGSFFIPIFILIPP